VRFPVHRANRPVKVARFAFFVHKIIRLLVAEDPAHRVVQALCRDFARFHGLSQRLSRVALNALRVAYQQQVHPGLHGAHTALRGAAVVIQCLHLHAIADDQALIPQGLPQQAGHHAL